MTQQWSRSRYLSKAIYDKRGKDKYYLPFYFDNDGLNDSSFVVGHFTLSTFVVTYVFKKITALVGS